MPRILGSRRLVTALRMMARERRRLRGNGNSSMAAMTLAMVFAGLMMEVLRNVGSLANRTSRMSPVEEGTLTTLGGSFRRLPRVNTSDLSQLVSAKYASWNVSAMRVMTRNAFQDLAISKLSSVASRHRSTYPGWLSMSRWMSPVLAFRVCTSGKCFVSDGIRRSHQYNSECQRVYRVEETASPCFV